MTDFRQILSSINTTPNGYAAVISDDWAQGRATYGGLVAALLVKAMRLTIGPEPALRSLLVTFTGPVAPGPVDLRAEVLRKGSSVANLEARLVQDGQVLCAALGSYGLERPAEISLEDQRTPDMPGPEESFPVPFTEGRSPEFMRHFDIRWALGAPPLSGAETSEIGGWMRFAEQDHNQGEHWWVALADAWPTPLLSMIKGPARFSSLAWSLDMAGLIPRQPRDGWWGYRATAESASGGYGQCRAEIWSPDGGLVMHSRQTVALFSKKG